MLWECKREGQRPASMFSAEDTEGGRSEGLLKGHVIAFL